MVEEKYIKVKVQKTISIYFILGTTKSRNLYFQFYNTI